MSWRFRIESCPVTKKRQDTGALQNAVAHNRILWDSDADPTVVYPTKMLHFAVFHSVLFRRALHELVPSSIQCAQRLSLCSRFYENLR